MCVAGEKYNVSFYYAAPNRLIFQCAVTPPAFLLPKTNQDPWSVNSLAAFAGERMFSDTAFHQETIALISGERKQAFQESVFNSRRSAAFCSGERIQKRR